MLGLSILQESVEVGDVTVDKDALQISVDVAWHSSVGPSRYNAIVVGYYSTLVGSYTLAFCVDRGDGFSDVEDEAFWVLLLIPIGCEESSLETIYSILMRNVP